jgi:hypothetical protein
VKKLIIGIVLMMILLINVGEGIGIPASINSEDLEKSDLIIFGKIKRIEELSEPIPLEEPTWYNVEASGGPGPGHHIKIFKNEATHLITLEVLSTLKGIKTNEVKVLFQSVSIENIITGKQFPASLPSVGDEFLLLLKKCNNNIYKTLGSGDNTVVRIWKDEHVYMKLNNEHISDLATLLDKLYKIISSIEKNQSEQPVNNELVLAIEIEQTQITVTSALTLSIKAKLKNISDKKLLVNLYPYVGDVPVYWYVEFTNSKGDTIARIGRGQNKSRPICKEDFVELEPGKEKEFFLPYGDQIFKYVKFLRNNEEIYLETLPPDKYIVRVIYVNKDDGKRFGLKNVWVGKVVSNKITIEVKK